MESRFCDSIHGSLVRLLNVVASRTTIKMSSDIILYSYVIVPYYNSGFKLSLGRHLHSTREPLNIYIKCIL